MPSYWQGRLLDAAVNLKPMSSREVVELFADEKNWMRIYDAAGCHWTWCGPVLPPWELAQDHAENAMQENDRRIVVVGKVPAGDQVVREGDVVTLGPKTRSGAFTLIHDYFASGSTAVLTPEELVRFTRHYEGP